MQENTFETQSKQMMAESKFMMGYSRWQEDKERYESWDESVERVMQMHREKYQDKMTPQLSELIDFAEQAYKEKLILGAQRALQFGGEQLKKHVARMYNCFQKDTKFVTSEGVHTFADFTHGDVIEVLTHKGNWKPATVKCYGDQKLNSVTFNKQTNATKVSVTANHRWILKDGTETTHLAIGDRIYKPQNIFADFSFDSATPEEKLYWCYGFVYGDGTRIADKAGEYKYSLVRLCGQGKQFSARFEEMGFKTSTNQSLKGDFIAYTGTYLKTSPDPEKDSPEMIRAFVAGYLDADGEKSKSTSGSRYSSIQSSEEDHIEFIRKCFPIAGVWIISEKELTGQETNYGIRPYTISFRISDNGGSKYNSGWVVSSIDEGVTEDVWCLEVEDDQSFVLSNGIVTGNCSAGWSDRPAFFQEAMYLLLCGAGVGFSVQKQHIAKLPSIIKRSSNKVKVFQPTDDVEGWADTFGVLVSSYFAERGTFPEYKGRQVHFDLSKIRPKGALISGGFRAPGPDGLRKALVKCEDILEQAVQRGESNLKPIHVYDFVMHMADAVLSGGVRRSATICMFSKDDTEMLNAKTGNWFSDNPQRGRSNNSVMLKRDEVTREEWAEIMKSVKQSGEPGFIWTDNLEFVFNPLK